MQGMPKPGRYYRHFKGGVYLVEDLAIDAADGGTAIVYSDLDGQVYVRRLESWLQPAAYTFWLRKPIPRYVLMET